MMYVDKSGQVPELVFMGCVGHLGCPQHILTTSAYAAVLVAARQTPLQVCIAASIGDICLVLCAITEMMI